MENLEDIIVKYTRIIHPEDLGVATSELEVHLREMLEEAIEFLKSEMSKYNK